jgi:hypothetical protein
LPPSFPSGLGEEPAGGFLGQSQVRQGEVAWRQGDAQKVDNDGLD